MLRNLFTRPKVELMTFNPDDRSLLFRSDRDLEIGTHKVQANVGEHSLKCEVKLESTEAELHFGYLLSPEDAVEPLSVLLPRPKVFEEQRAYERQDRVLRVSSAHLPSYQAYSVDLSMGGMKLRTQAELELREYLDCTIEFDDISMQHVKVSCEVKWCRPLDGGDFEVGVGFVEMAPDTRARLAWFLKAITEVEHGVLTTVYAVFD